MRRHVLLGLVEPDPLLIYPVEVVLGLCATIESLKSLVLITKTSVRFPFVWESLCKAVTDASEARWGGT